MGDILERILDQRRADVALARVSEEACNSVLSARITSQYPSSPLDLYAIVAGCSGQCIAAEFKRASPSKGPIAAPDISLAVHAQAYIAGGASIISVLTEPTWFKGSLDDMETVRRLADAHAAQHGGRRPAVLRKDFIVDAYQLAEARAWGADTALLIVAALKQEDLAPLIAAARGLGMEPLVEVCRCAEAELLNGRE